MFKNSLLFSMLLSFMTGAHFRLYNGDPDAGGGSGGSGGTPPAGTPRGEPETFSRQYVHELREEAKTWRTKAAELERTHKETADRITALEREHGEKLTAAEKKANDRIIAAELRAVAAKHGMVDLDAIKLLDMSSIKLTQEGTVEGAEALFEAAKKAKPYLFNPDSNSSSFAGKPPTPAKGEKKSASDMSAEEWAAEKRRLGLR